MLALIQSGKLKEHILLVQGGTTTFLGAGAEHGRDRSENDVRRAKSHLGILSREFQMPCVMTAYLTDSPSRYVTGGDNNAHFAALVKALDGKRVQLNVEDREFGRVALVG